MKNIILISLLLLLYSCNNTEEPIVNEQPIENIVYVTTVCDSLQAKIDSIENSKLNRPEYFIVTWSSNNVSFIVLNMRHYEYVLTHMDNSRINGKLDRDRLTRLCNYIYKNQVTKLEVKSYGRNNYRLSKYNIIKIVNFPEMMIYY